jgi:arginase
VWLLTRDSPFCAGSPLSPSRVTVIGASAASQSRPPATRAVSLADIRRTGPAAAARLILDSIPASAALLLHLDVDVFAQRDMPAAYFPHADGLSLAEGAALLGTLTADPRLRFVEIAEYASLRDQDQRCAVKLVDLLASVIRS